MNNLTLYLKKNKPRNITSKNPKQTEGKNIIEIRMKINEIKQKKQQKQQTLEQIDYYKKREDRSN